MKQLRKGNQHAHEIEYANEHIQRECFLLPISEVGHETVNNAKSSCPGIRLSFVPALGNAVEIVIQHSVQHASLKYKIKLLDAVTMSPEINAKQGFHVYRSRPVRSNAGQVSVRSQR
ncbi:hypothetical protein OUZ56_015136 [Daphnia magna]|uniref:Uncharacterized protein n=1 Tax=Daphnia magna TaxID=35525 RepID=A0ABR0ALW6_9CRUS|nr:hypothetical protein OUZ56_015136 [Daphnia magna]